MSTALRILACIVLGYLFGTMNGAILISKLTKHEDVREKGSGNAGLTNFLRSYGGWSTLLVIVIDLGKMVAACLLATLIYTENTELAKMMTGVAVQVGHIFPIFFGLRGGKGILTSSMLALMMDWRIFAIIMTVFILTFILTKYVSLGSILAAISFGAMFVVFFTGQPWIWGLGVFMAALAIFMHRGNIERLIHGTERKTYLRKNKNEG